MQIRELKEGSEKVLVQRTRVTTTTQPPLIKCELARKRKVLRKFSCSEHVLHHTTTPQPPNNHQRLLISELKEGSEKVFVQRIVSEEKNDRSYRNEHGGTDDYDDDDVDGGDWYTYELHQANVNGGIDNDDDDDGDGDYDDDDDAGDDDGGNWY